jgi:hypothetical protein
MVGAIVPIAVPVAVSLTWSVGLPAVTPAYALTVSAGTAATALAPLASRSSDARVAVALTRRTLAVPEDDPPPPPHAESASAAHATTIADRRSMFFVTSMVPLLRASTRRSAGRC